MKPVQVGTRIDREGFEHAAMCCEQSKEQFKNIENVMNALRVIWDFFDPKFYNVISGHLPPLNYCPHCGTKINIQYQP